MALRARSSNRRAVLPQRLHSRRMARLRSKKQRSPAAAQQKKPPSPTDQAVLLGQFGEWGAYRATPGGKKICFALSKPTSVGSEPSRAHPRCGLCLHFNPAFGEGEERGVGDCRLSAESRSRCQRRCRFFDLRYVHAERWGLGKERGRRSRRWLKSCGAALIWSSRANPHAAPKPRTPIRSRASPRLSTRLPRSAGDP